MSITLHQSNIITPAPNLTITGSKSESNRLLLLQALYPDITLKNLSNSDDSKVMNSALQSSSDLVDIGHAGTAMRFLTAFFAVQTGRSVTLTGSERMCERPIKILVEALQTLGAEIEYLGKKGYPPLKISGKTLLKNTVTLDAGVSSQYISALLLIASKLQNGLVLNLKGTITSAPYIQMTLSLLKTIGVRSSFENNCIKILSGRNPDKVSCVVESDWSSASYFFSIIALSPIGTEIGLTSYQADSLQGDAVLVTIYKHFGVGSYFSGNTLRLKKIAQHDSLKTIDLTHAPDIAQTVAVTCLGLGIACQLTGLHTLKIKETDRLVALKNEMEKLGASVHITQNSLELSPTKTISPKTTIKTYNDHRMAMAFAPLALKTSLLIENPEVASKSYPDFWNDLKRLGFQIAK